MLMKDGYMTKESKIKILALERKRYRKIVPIGWSQKVTNDELHIRVQNSTSEVTHRKYNCLFRHIGRMNDSPNVKSLVCVIMDGKNKGHTGSGLTTAKQVPSHSAQEGTKWNMIGQETSDFNGS